MFKNFLKVSKTNFVPCKEIIRASRKKTCDNTITVKKQLNALRVLDFTLHY